MAIPLREYLAQRRTEIQTDLKALRVELAELDAAERALPDAGAGAQKRERGATGTGKKTLKELALDALYHYPAGADAQTILSWIKHKHGIEVARESMSPQLSRLGQDRIIKRDGLLWRLVDGTRGESIWGPPGKEETPDVAASDASSLEVDLDDEIPF